MSRSYKDYRKEDSPMPKVKRHRPMKPYNRSSKHRTVFDEDYDEYVHLF